MIIPDINLLVHAYDPGFPLHTAARSWWEETLDLERPVGLAWAVILGFLRLTTNRAVALIDSGGNGSGYWSADAYRIAGSSLSTFHE